MITSATISVAGDPSVGIPRATFELTGGDFILDPEVFSDPCGMVEEFRYDLVKFADEWLGDGKTHVFLHGWDAEENHEGLPGDPAEYGDAN